MSLPRPTGPLDPLSAEGPAACGDGQLLARIAANDPEAFQILYHRYHRFLFNLSLQIASNRHQAEEALQEAMLRIWRSARNFKADGNARGWMARIVVRECLKHRPSRIRHRAYQAEIALEKLEQPSGRPFEEIDDAEQVALLRRGLKTLPPESRRILVLYFGAGFSQCQIGSLLKLPQSTVSQQLSSALRHLRREMLGQEALLGLPLLFEELLCLAPCEPQGVPARLESAIQDRSEAHTRQAASRPWHAPAWVTWSTAVAAVAIILLGTWVAPNTPLAEPVVQPSASGRPMPNTAALPASEPAQPPPDAPDATGSRLRMAWDFSTQLPPGFEPLRGFWSPWQPGQESRMEEVAARRLEGQLVTFKLPLRIPKRPLRITARVEVPQAGFSSDLKVSCGLAAYWHPGASLPGGTRWKNRRRTQLGLTHAVEYETYVRERWIITGIRNAQEWSTLSENPDPYPASELELGIHTYVVRNLAIEEIGPEEIPAPIRSPEQVKALVEGTGSSWVRMP